MESVVENKFQVWFLLPHHGSDIAVELLEYVDIGRPPGLVDRLNSGKGGMVTPSIEKTLNGVLGPVDVVVVD